MSERFVVVMKIAGAFFGRLLEAQSARANGDAIAVFQNVLVPRLTVDKNLVGTAPELTTDNGSVDDRHHAILRCLDVRVITRCPRVVEHHQVVRRPANRTNCLRRQNVLPLASARVCDLDECHSLIKP